MIGSKMKVLVADDEPVARTLFSHWLKTWGYEVIIAVDGSEAIAALEKDPSIRLALVDWMMPGLSGVQVIERVRARESDAYVYVMLVTARDDTSDLVEGLDSGADDYIVKPCNPLELKVRLRAGRRMVELQEQLVHAREALRFEAMHDALTGLVNRRAAERTLEQEIARASRSGSELSVLLIDLDRFKSINDTHGHDGGDAVLRAAARCFESGVRSYDQVARYGGEEFLVILPGCNAEDARIVADRLRDDLRARSVPLPTGTVSFSASIGVAAWAERSCRDARTLLSAADRALYRAKHLGRDRTEIAGHDSTESHAPDGTGRADSRDPVSSDPFHSLALG